MRRTSRTSRCRATSFNGSGFSGTVSYDFNDNLQLVYIGSYREYNSKFGQDQDATPVPVAQLDNELNHHAFTSEVRLNMKSAGGFIEGTVGAFYLDQEGIYTARVDLNYVQSGHRLPARPGHHAQQDQGGVRHGDHSPDGCAELHRWRALHQGREGLHLLPFQSGWHRSEPRALLSCRSSSPTRTACSRASTTSPAASRAIARTGASSATTASTDHSWLTPRCRPASRAAASTRGRSVVDQRLPFQPETLTTYEVGFKSDLLDRRLRVNGAVFLNKYEDIQSQQAGLPGIGSVSVTALPAP